MTSYNELTKQPETLLVKKDGRYYVYTDTFIINPLNPQERFYEIEKDDEEFEVCNEEETKNIAHCFTHLYRELITKSNREELQKMILNGLLKTSIEEDVEEEHIYRNRRYLAKLRKIEYKAKAQRTRKRKELIKRNKK